MPWVYRFNASVTKSTLPVRSPLPNKQPSTRVAPASMASSAQATPVPRSLCGWMLMVICDKSEKFCISHSIWSAYTLGVFISTVAGRLIIMGRSAVGCQTALTASQISKANSRSVKQKVSGEYSNCHWVLGFCSQCCLTNFAPFTANSMVLALSCFVLVTYHLTKGRGGGIV